MPSFSLTILPCPRFWRSWLRGFLLLLDCWVPPPLPLSLSLWCLSLLQLRLFLLLPRVGLQARFGTQKEVSRRWLYTPSLFFFKVAGIATQKGKRWPYSMSSAILVLKRKPYPSGCASPAHGPFKIVNMLSLRRDHGARHRNKNTFAWRTKQSKWPWWTS